MRRQRRDVDDRPARHRGAEDLAREHRAVEVEPDDLVERGGRELEERPLTDRRGGDVAASGVDEDVDLAPAVEHRGASALELGGVEHVGLEGDGGLAKAPRELFEGLTPPCEEADPCARRGEALRDCATENA